MIARLKNWAHLRFFTHMVSVHPNTGAVIYELCIPKKTNWVRKDGTPIEPKVRITVSLNEDNFREFYFEGAKRVVRILQITKAVTTPHAALILLEAETGLVGVTET